MILPQSQLARASGMPAPGSITITNFENCNKPLILEEFNRWQVSAKPQFSLFQVEIEPVAAQATNWNLGTPFSVADITTYISDMTTAIRASYSTNVKLGAVVTYESYPTSSTPTGTDICYFYAYTNVSNPNSLNSSCTATTPSGLSLDFWGLDQFQGHCDNSTLSLSTQLSDVAARLLTHSANPNNIPGYITQTDVPVWCPVADKGTEANAYIGREWVGWSGALTSFQPAYYQLITQWASAMGFLGVSNFCSLVQLNETSDQSTAVCATIPNGLNNLVPTDTGYEMQQLNGWWNVSLQGNVATSGYAKTQ